MKTKKGQALTEALMAGPVVIACFVLCIGLFHGYTQQLWIDHQLYQSLICLAKGESQSRCAKTMKQKIKAFLWIGKLKNIKLYKQEEKWSGSFTWETPWWKIPFKKSITKGDLL